MKVHSGSMDIVSTPGDGTTVTLTLPALSAAAHTITPATSATVSA
jgi:signal transduction histidine kinase